MFEKIYFEQYVLNSEREITGRTIRETDIVLHAGQTGDFSPHHWMRNGAKASRSNNVLPMEPWSLAQLSA
jgi:acyl dehydratase